jgi:signal transduction histidine kinase
MLGGLVTVIAVVGIVPYIALQLKAVSNTFEIIRQTDATSNSDMGNLPPLQDTALYVALLLAGFGILFGTRHLDATERHEGVVAAIAFESVIKLIAFLAAGLFVTFGLFRGFGDLFSRAEHANLNQLFTLQHEGGYGNWAWLLVLSMLAIVLLPRQWQITVVENVDERHLKRAMWLFPLYLLVINVFVLPIAAAGSLRLGSTVDSDTYVLALPMAAGQHALALFVFIGGVSAATGMIIVETIALSTMVSNSLVMPLLLRGESRLAGQPDLSRMVLGIRRVTIVAVLLLGYAYVRLAGRGLGLVPIGLVSFAAVAQFAPALLGGLFWKGGTRKGALVGIVGGFLIWAYTLLLPSFVDAGLISGSLINEGPLGIRALRPKQLFGLSGLDNISHAMFWSMLINIGTYVAISLFARTDPSERAKAVRFLEDLPEPALTHARRGRVSVGELRALLDRFLGRTGAVKTLQAYPWRKNPADLAPAAQADPELVQDVETVLAGSVGSVSARLVVASVAGEEEQLGRETVMEIIDEASHVAALEERNRLARELHDSVSQALFSMTLHTRAMELAAQKEGLGPQNPLMRNLAHMRGLTQDALSEMRALIFQLRPDVLQQGGLTAAVRKHAATLTTQHGQAIDVHAPAERLSLDEWAEKELFRVVQEALNNSVKHAQAQHVDIRIHDGCERAGELVIEIADDGIGFDPRFPRKGHFGLDGMQERIEQLGGHLTIVSQSGSTLVRAVLPGILLPAASDSAKAQRSAGDG